MQPIERVGLFALLFLAAIVGAVVMFDRQPEDLSSEVAAKDKTALTQQHGERGTQTVPQLGQTTRSSGEPSTSAESDWKRRKALRDAQLAEEARANEAKASLPVSVPTPSLTPAPKPNSASGSTLQVPANEPKTAVRLKPQAETLVPKTSESSSEAANIDRARGAAPATTRSSNPLGEYVVRKGDTLSEISLRQLGTSTRWKELEQLNGVSATQLKVGMKLKLPSGRALDSTPASNSLAAVAKPAATTAAKPTASGASYRVDDGDSLWVIAQRQLGDGNRWSEIAALNPKIDPDKLIVGATLALPTGAAPAKTTTIAKNTTPARSTSSKPRVR